MSTSLLAAAIGASRAEYVDATDVIATDRSYGNAAPELGVTEKRARERLLPILKAGLVPVVPGFIGRAPDGSVDDPGARRLPT